MLIIKGGERLPEPDVIPTPSFGLNRTLGGGLWSGRYHILWGNPQAGKTTMALHTMAEAQKQGYVPVIIDAEGSITDQWLDHCGIDLETRIVMRSTRLEDILGEIMPMVREKESKYIFLVDSINSIVMEAFYKKDDGTGAIGVYARSQTVFFQKISDIVIQDVNHIFLIIAQQTITSKGQFMVTDGKFGNAARHWATNIIKLSASDSQDDTEKDDDEKILNKKVTWKIQKSKQTSVQGTKGDYWFSPATAEINQYQEIFHLAVRNGIIKKGGAWYTYGDHKYQGEKKFLDSVGEDTIQEILEELHKLEEWDFDVEEVKE
jgi:recombination protein RecA